MNDLIHVWLTQLSHLFGGSLGLGIIVLSLAIRAALLPLTVWLSRRSEKNREMMRKLEPEIAKLKRRHARNPERLMKEMGDLYRSHGCSPFDLPVLIGSFLPLPIFGMLSGAIRSSLSSSSTFLWVRNLAAPDILITGIILLLTAVSVHLAPSASAQVKQTMMLIQLVMTFFFVWKMAAGLGLYWAVSSAVGICQTWWLGRRQPDGVMPALRG